jgi:hypothetical protein
MVNHFNEQNRRDLGIVWFMIGGIFLLVGFSGGFVFLLLGLTWLASVAGEGLELFRSKPDLMRSLLQHATIVLLGIALVVLLINAAS